MLITSLAFLMLAYFAITRQVPGMLFAFVLFGIGVGLFQSPNNTTIMSALPRQHMAVASSVTATGRNLGMALGVSFGSILLTLQLGNAGYHGAVLDADPLFWLFPSAGLWWCQRSCVYSWRCLP